MENCDVRHAADDDFSHLHLVGVETHEPLDSDLLARARVVDVFALPEAALVHAHVRQLTEPPRLTVTTGNNKAD